MITNPMWKLVNLPKITDARGNLSFIEGGNRHVPFDIKRVYYLYDVPADADRGAHGHKDLQQLIIAISGSFEVVLDNGYVKETFQLRRPWQGLYIPAGTWRDLINFSSGAVSVVLASEYYEEADYFRDYGDFIDYIHSK